MPFDDALNVLHDTYGYTEFKGSQEEIIQKACSGFDVLVLMPTGGGKSLCYQIPALIQPGLTIVVSPLIALMHDQVHALHELGVAAAYLNSTLPSQVQSQVLQDARDGELDLLYVAPERLLLSPTLDALAQCHVNLIAIDEAHCVSSWGHDFRQDYLRLDILREYFPNVPRMALTATADPRTRQDIIQQLKLADPQVFVEGFDRPNICYTVQPKTDPRKQLLNFLEDRRQSCGIVYCLSRNSVNQTAEFLHLQGFHALAYHAGMDAKQRQKHQDIFLKEDAVVMVATIAFGMGIDKPDVRFVAHLDLPKSVEAYYQETGRAGRDGAPADAWMIYGLQDVVRLSKMVQESPADEAHKRVERAKLDALLGWCEVTSCRRNALLAYFGEEHVTPCGNCDICLNPPLTWDATEAAQKALSCVYRTGQRFGAGHVIDVLRGQNRAKVQQFEHQRLSTFGIGKEFSDQQWRSIFRQLVVRGYLEVDHTRYGALVLTSASRAILRGEKLLNLREETSKTKRRLSKASYTLEIEDEDLMDALKTLRKTIAEEQGVPPYVVFHDATLIEMLQHRPTSLQEMLEISGVGQAKLQNYGQRFLETIAAH